ncbi:MAG: hypothetical protein OEN55_16640 [Alphaproteobacteria bacterium]|nr:hypothetical protein [Alphaproteobacteria bacterium]
MQGHAAVALLLMPLLWGIAHAATGEDDRIIGLLALPQLFGTGPCDVETETRPLDLFDSADSTTPVGEVRVDAPWKMAAEGGCEMLEVGVHLAGADGVVQPLPADEYGYEEAGAVVLARRGDRFKIALQNGAAWVEPLAGAEFHPLEDLIVGRLSFLTGAWDGKICADPGDSGSCREIGPWVDDELNVTVLGHRETEGRLWFEIEAPTRDTCGEPVPDFSPVRGWISAHHDNGEPAIWFYSRGC